MNRLVVCTSCQKIIGFRSVGCLNAFMSAASSLLRLKAVCCCPFCRPVDKNSNSRLESDYLTAEMVSSLDDSCFLYVQFPCSRHMSKLKASNVGDPPSGGPFTDVVCGLRCACDTCQLNM